MNRIPKDGRNGNTKAGTRKTRVCGIAAGILAALLLPIGCLIHAARHKAADIGFSGTVRAESLAVREVEAREPAPREESFGEPATAFSELVAENENGESVFAVPIETFLDRFNSVYLQTHETGYLNPTSSENWYCFDDRSPCFGYASVRYLFSEDKTVWSMPTISIYANDKDELYEIRMVFDDHGYQDRFYELFRELCVCMEKLLMPELSTAEAETLFETLYARSDDNFFGDHAAFDDPERPALNAVYRDQSIGMYCFYGPGTIEICFVPLTARAVAILEENGIPLPDREDAD